MADPRNTVEMLAHQTPSGQDGSNTGHTMPAPQRNVIRDTDANVLQRLASDPLESVWVGASAGTGKTKVLTDRVLRLLLPADEQTPGTPPHKILCLTYTKAAANEMALRISATLAEWAIMPETLPAGAPPKTRNLRQTLETLQGRPPFEYEIKAARSLFARVIDTPGGIKMMTIHSFCQSVLGRFPLEAGIRPNQAILDDAGTTALINAAQNAVYQEASHNNASNTAHAINHLAQNISADQFAALLKSVLSERNQMQKILGGWGADGLYSRLCQALEIREGQSKEDIILRFCSDGNLPLAALREIVSVMAHSKSSTDNSLGQNLALWVNMDENERGLNFDLPAGIFQTSSGSPRAKLMTKAPAEQNPELLEIFTALQDEYFACLEVINKVQCTALTRDLFLLGEKIVNKYQEFKSAQGALDYDDLITLTYQLLANETVDPALGNMPGWVHYKLDQGLDHILIDEAQDTNPEQWKIIKALTHDFFDGQTARSDITRTLFTVGDEKQSIYSFQRASPEEFDRMRSAYAQELAKSGNELKDIALQTSFRSTPSVLEAVDMVFSLPDLATDPGFEAVKHISHRSGQAGEVTLWPLFEAEKSEENPDPWEPPTTLSSAQSASSLCARSIAEKVAEWITNKEPLHSHDRRVQAGDIMILVRTRTAFVNQLIRELKARSIPVAGHDRMVLNNQLAVQDLLALCEFALLPDDDLTLASLLKSPLIGLNEDQLFKLAIERRPLSLWQKLGKAPEYSAIRSYLQGYIDRAGAARPYEFLSLALSQECPLYKVSGLSAMKSRLGQDCLDPLNELLNAALHFETNHIPTLQGFVRWQKSGNTDIKRELEESGGQVRIMTIHGSKGLQAPIVIMPDTVRTRRKNALDAGSNLLWPQKTGMDIPLWSPRKSLNFNLYDDATAIIDKKIEQEYRRLLYVAMTRAEDRLYITGYKGKNNPPDDCWYNIIARALEKSPSVIRRADGSMTLMNNQEKPADRTPKDQAGITAVHEAPEWLNQSAPSEPTPPRPLIPSRPSQSEPAALSPLQSAGHDRFRRGNLTHKLLQFLPDIIPELREETANAFLERFAHDLSASIKGDILKECLAILNDARFAPLFTPLSRAEVPITGLLNGTELVSGQIDRLAIGDNDIWIADYKTNRPPPSDPADIPAVYRSQLRTYRDVLRSIYPEHTIHCALIWTDGPILMPIEL